MAFLKIFFYSGQHNTRITTCLILPAWTGNWITWAKIFLCQMTKSSLDTELGKKQRQMLQTVKSISFVKMLLPHIISKCGSTVKSISTVLNWNDFHLENKLLCSFFTLGNYTCNWFQEGSESRLTPPTQHWRTPCSNFSWERTQK